MFHPSRLLAALARRGVAAEDRARLAALRYDDAGHGYDAFGLHPDGVALGLALTRPLYERWFRVQSRGAEHVPAAGPVILAANHGGLLPFDALMLWADVVRHTNPPRVARAVADNFVPMLPFVSTLFARGGVVGGSRGNVHKLLERGEMIMIFPEGTSGIGKRFRDRYQLQAWRVGHAEMALRHRAPVVPVAVVGPDEQFPLAVRLPLHDFGAPYVPVSVPPLPLPVRYRVRYGAPIDLGAAFAPADADRPDRVREAAAVVRNAVRDLLAAALRERTSVFR